MYSSGGRGSGGGRGGPRETPSGYDRGVGGRGSGGGGAAYYSLGSVALGSAVAHSQRQSPAFPLASEQAYAAYGLVPPPSQMPASYASGGSNLPSQRAHEQFAAGQGKAHVQARFISEGLRQQLQQNAYLVQAQVIL
jgi:hypothetical protein